MAIKAKLLSRWPSAITGTVPIVATKANGAITLSYDSSGLPTTGSVSATAKILTRDGAVYQEVLATAVSFPTVADQRLLGNVSGGTAGAAALTGTQANTVLPAFTGDSGSGGVKGLVPAPSAGDAAAGRFLAAGGTFSAPTFTQSGTGAVSRLVTAKLQDVISVKDFGAVGDGATDDRAAIQAAVDAVPSAGAAIMFPAGTYLVSGAITVTKSRVAFISEGRRQATIQSSSTTADIFTVGAAAASFIYDIVFEGLVFLRSSTCSAGASINLTNVGYSAIRNCRFYGDSKSWQHLKMRSVYLFYIERNLFESPIREQIDLAGSSSTPGGNTDGQSIDVFVNDNQFSGGHAATASPTLQGCVRVGDYSGGLFFNNNECYNFKGYFIYLIGTAPGAAYNFLVFINNPNVEATNSISGFLKAEYFSNIVVTHGWVSGKDTATVSIGQNVNGLQLTALQIAISYTTTLAPAVDLSGTDVQITGCYIVGYDANVGPAVSLGSTSDRVLITGSRLIQCQYGVYAVSATGKEYSIVANAFKNNVLANIAGIGADDGVVIIGNMGLTYSQTVSNFYAGGTVTDAAAQFASNASNVNQWYFSGGTVGNQVFCQAQGTDTNISATITSKGTGNVNISGNGGSKSGIAVLGAAQASAETALFLNYHNGTSEVFKQVTLGAADSGGAGFKVLRVPNT